MRRAALEMHGGRAAVVPRAIGKKSHRSGNVARPCLCLNKECAKVRYEHANKQRSAVPSGPANQERALAIVNGKGLKLLQPKVGALSCQREHCARLPHLQMYKHPTSCNGTSTTVVLSQRWTGMGAEVKPPPLCRRVRSYRPPA